MIDGVVKYLESGLVIAFSILFAISIHPIEVFTGISILAPISILILGLGILCVAIDWRAPATLLIEGGVAILSVLASSLLSPRQTSSITVLLLVLLIGVLLYRQYSSSKL